MRKQNLTTETAEQRLARYENAFRLLHDVENDNSGEVLGLLGEAIMNHLVTEGQKGRRDPGKYESIIAIYTRIQDHFLFIDKEFRRGLPTYLRN